jgi:hypothetical protein
MYPCSHRALSLPPMPWRRSTRIVAPLANASPESGSLSTPRAHRELMADLDGRGDAQLPIGERIGGRAGIYEEIEIARKTASGTTPECQPRPDKPTSR